MSDVRIAGLERALGGHPVLRGVDLSLPHGTVTAVLGPSGCGKTTLLRVVAGFLEPDAGTVTIGDDVVAGGRRHVPPQRRRVGYVAQEGALFPHLDVRGNILFGLPRALRTDARLKEMLDLAELPQRVVHAMPHELSGGQQQRVALARALAPNPRVVLLDEPFSSLDAALRESAGQAVVRVLRAAETTGVLVTHDQSEALSLADSVAVMEHGLVVQSAAPQTLYAEPHSVGIARFVGGANVLHGQVVDGVAHTGAGTLPLAPTSVTGPAQLVIRPEQLEVSLDPAVGAPAMVEEVAFYGHDANLRLRLESIPLAGPPLLARLSHGPFPVVGDRVGVRVVGEVRAFAPERIGEDA